MTEVEIIVFALFYVLGWASSTIFIGIETKAEDDIFPILCLCVIWPLVLFIIICCSAASYMGKLHKKRWNFYGYSKIKMNDHYGKHNWRIP